VKHSTPERFLVTYPSLVFCIGFLAIRMLFPGGAFYSFMLGNLVLAWIPYCLSGIAYSRDRPRFDRLQLAMIAATLLFLPNSFYMVTDFIHIKLSNDFIVWFDILLVASFTWLGMLYGFIALRRLQLIFTKRFGPFTGWWLVAGVILLSCVGMFLGRVARFYSWDVVVHPVHVGSYVANHALAPESYPHFAAFVMAFSLFIGTVYASVYLGRKR